MRLAFPERFVRCTITADKIYISRGRRLKSGRNIKMTKKGIMRSYITKDNKLIIDNDEGYFEVNLMQVVNDDEIWIHGYRKYIEYDFAIGDIEDLYMMVGMITQDFSYDWQWECRKKIEQALRILKH